MFTLLFLILGSLAIWTGVTLIKKGPNDDEIKILLKDMAASSLKLANLLIEISIHIKSLFNLLKQSNEQLDVPANQNSQKKPNLVSLDHKETKKVA